jgi:hypothetical protein
VRRRESKGLPSPCRCSRLRAADGGTSKMAELHETGTSVPLSPSLDDPTVRDSIDRNVLGVHDLTRWGKRAELSKLCSAKPMPSGHLILLRNEVDDFFLPIGERRQFLSEECDQVIPAANTGLTSSKAVTNEVRCDQSCQQVPVLLVDCRYKSSNEVLLGR